MSTSSLPPSHITSAHRSPSQQLPSRSSEHEVKLGPELELVLGPELGLELELEPES